MSSTGIYRSGRAVARAGAAPKVSSSLNAVDLLLAAIFFIGPWGSYIQFATGVTLASIPIAAGIALLGLAFAVNFRSQPFAQYDLLLVGVLAIAGLSLFWSLYPEIWAVTFSWYCLGIGLYAMARSSAASKHGLYVVVMAGLAGALFSTFLIDTAYNEWGLALERKAIEGHNNNFTSYSICTSICAAFIYRKLYRPGRIFDWILGVTIVVSLYNIYLLGTRGAVISVVALCLSVFVPDRLAKPAFAVAGIAFLVLAFANAFGLVEAALYLLDSSSMRSDGELAGRIPTWYSARELIYARPILGIGIGAFSHVGIMQIPPHNAMLTLFLDLGTIGALVFVAWMALGYTSVKLPGALKYHIPMLHVVYALPIALSGEWLLAPMTWAIAGITFGAMRNRA